MRLARTVLIVDGVRYPFINKVSIGAQQISLKQGYFCEEVNPVSVSFSTRIKSDTVQGWRIEVIRYIMDRNKKWIRIKRIVRH